MAIDDRIDAAQAVVKAEVRDSVFVPPFLQKVVALLPSPFGKFVSTALSTFAADRLGQIEYLLEVFAGEIKRLRIDLDALTEDQRRQFDLNQPGLLRDAAQRASTSRTRLRVRWLGHILAHGIVPTEPGADPDSIEELLRVAMELTPNDVLVLREIYMRQQELIAPLRASDASLASLPVSFMTNQMHNFKVPGIGDIELQSIFQKLMNSGMISRVPDSRDFGDHRFLMLYKGYDFVKFATGESVDSPDQTTDSEFSAAPRFREDQELIKRKLYSAVVSLLQRTWSQTHIVRTAHFTLPGYLWAKRDSAWHNTVSRLGDTTSGFRPHVAAAQIQQVDDALLDDVAHIADLYLWASVNTPDFEDIRSQHRLPPVDKIREFLEILQPTLREIRGD